MSARFGRVIGDIDRDNARRDIPERQALIFALFACAAFLGASLGFQIQPLVSRAILPWFGGGPAVWTVCLLFFQTTLFLGYAYAYRLVRCSAVPLQVSIYGVVAFAALLLPVLPSSSWKPKSDDSPEWQILLLLAAHTGLPFLVLSATGPLLQVWFLKAAPKQLPYRLYAYSNCGSLLGLMIVPFVLEQWFSLEQQARIWHGCFASLLILVLICGILALKQVETEPGVNHKELRHGVTTGVNRCSLPHSIARGRLWFLLSMTPVILLAAVTGKLTTDISPVPFLWIVPLAVYLVSLIVCFSRDSLAIRAFWMPTCGVLLLTSGICLCLKDSSWVHSSLPWQFTIHLGTLAASCMVCHGELVRLKPDMGPERRKSDHRLTEFYLIMAFGGAVGGVLTALVAPLVFPAYWEYHIGLFAAGAVPLIVFARDSRSSTHPSGLFIRKTVSAVGLTILAALLITNVVMYSQDCYAVSRSFFGVSRILKRQDSESQSPYAFELVHGTTIHGFQFVSPELMNYPTTYYGPSSGVGIALQSHQIHRPRRIGIIGLGVGTLAAYGRPGDILDFYEIDPVVRDFSVEFFRYVSDSPSTTTVIPGDGRLSLERRRQVWDYDVLVLDAFSSDAIPVHLLTIEAFETYQQHIAQDGIVAVHISNHNFDLRPVLLANAERLKWKAICIEDISFDASRMTLPTYWVLMSPEPSTLEATGIAQAKTVPMTKAILWSDARHSLIQILGGPIH